jgi:hypothetical protein
MFIFDCFGWLVAGSLIDRAKQGIVMGSAPNLVRQLMKQHERGLEQSAFFSQ